MIFVIAILLLLCLIRLIAIQNEIAAFHRSYKATVMADQTRRNRSK